MSAALGQQVWDALDTVLDPELDESIVALEFVQSCTVSDDPGSDDPDGSGALATVRLRLPTFFCSPNFSWLMVADAFDAVSAVPGIGRVDLALVDHFVSEVINQGVAARSGFVAAFPGEAVAELDDLRAAFLRKAALAGQERVARPLVNAGATPDELAGLRLGRVPPSVDLDRLRTRRSQVGLPHDDDAPLLLHPDGEPVTSAQVPLHLRRARLTGVSIEANGGTCRDLLAQRYGEERFAATS